MDNPNKSYRLSKVASKTAHFEEKTQGYSLGFVKIWPVTKLESKHIIGKAFSRAIECIL